MPRFLTFLPTVSAVLQARKLFTTSPWFLTLRLSSQPISPAMAPVDTGAPEQSHTVNYLSPLVNSDHSPVQSLTTSVTEGFPGSARVFMFEFSMPDEPQHNGEPGGNEPAIWLLNSRIPNTAQYNTCNCWASGCGELDIFEIIYPGQTKAVSTFHLDGDGKSAGDANWLQRPTGGPIKLAVVMDATNGGTVSIKNMGASDGGRFGGSLSASQVEGLKAKSGLVSEYVRGTRNGHQETDRSKRNQGKEG